MNDIIINKENKEIYEQYLSIQTNQSKKDKIVTTILSLGILSIGLCSSCFIQNSILHYIVGSISVGSILATVYIREKSRINKNKKNFKLKYPSLDTNLSINEIEKALDKYNESLQVEEMLLEDTSFTKQTLEEKVRIVDRFQDMSNDQKISFLKKEKDFYEQEKLRSEEEQKAIQKKL